MMKLIDFAIYLCTKFCPFAESVMPFIDIAFEAEISRFEDSEFDEYARRNCDESPENKLKAVEELRRMIYGERCIIYSLLLYCRML